MRPAAEQGGAALPLVVSEGFRFFFLAGPMFAVLGMLVWIGWLGVHAAGAAFTYVPFAVPPHQWHAHEMIYGYGAAVMAGFFLTAVPNWTGSAPARANFIAVIAALWLAGRIGMLFSAELPASVVMAVDVLFVPVLGLKILVNLLKRPKLQNVMFLALLALMTLGNLLVHLGWAGHIDDGAAMGVRVGLLTLAALIAILGGRVTPAFTRNALMRVRGEDRLPVNHDMADRIAIPAAIALPILAPIAPNLLLAVVAGVAGIANALRLSGWRGLDVLDSPILWSLHLGFLLLVLGYLVLALHWLGAPIGETSALHLLAIGAVGVMTLAVMSRAALGHSGRPLVVARPIAVAYLLVAAAAGVRSLGLVLAPGHYYAVMFTAGGLWIAAFCLFIWVYAPILTSPRADRPA